MNIDNLYAEEIPALISSIEEAGSDNHRVFGGTWTGGYAIQQDPSELAALVRAIGAAGGVGNYLQIGIAAGGTERFLCERCEVQELSVIDDGKHPANKIWRAQNKAAIESRDVKVTEFIGSSHGLEAARFLTEGRPAYDLIGIDGDHTPAGVRLDWALVKPFIPIGGLIWFHDINCLGAGETGAREFWSKAKRMEGFEVRLETVGRFGIGLLRRVA